MRFGYLRYNEWVFRTGVSWAPVFLQASYYKFLQEININYGFKINFGLNYFPPKELNGKKYDEGYYESVLITLGEGSGDNWWCILFPSICLTEENANYESLIKNIFEKIFY